MLFRRRSSLTPTRAAALAGAMRAPTFELVPLKNALDQAGFLPPGATVSVTASPAKGIEATVALCEQLQARGFRAVPHLSARMIRDRAHLSELIARLESAGVSGSSVLPVIAGRGHDGAWSSAGHIGDAGRMVAIVCLVDSNNADAVLDAVFAIVTRQIGLVSMTDVVVVRPDRF